MVELSAVVGDERNLVHQKLTLVTALTVTSVCSNCAPVLQEQEREKAGSGVAWGPDYHRFITSCLPNLLPHGTHQCSLLLLIIMNSEQTYLIKLLQVCWKSRSHAMVITVSVYFN